MDSYRHLTFIHGMKFLSFGRRGWFSEETEKPQAKARMRCAYLRACVSLVHTVVGWGAVKHTVCLKNPEWFRMAEIRGTQSE